MPKSKRNCNRKKCNKSRRRQRGGDFFPTVDNVIPYNQSLGTAGDPTDPRSIIDSRGLPNIKVGGKRKSSNGKRKLSNGKRSRKYNGGRKLNSRRKLNGGGIFNYDLLTGESHNQNAVQSLNASSGTQNGAYKLMGIPQERGPTLSMDGLPSKGLV
jgi:hypothetical protein